MVVLGGLAVSYERGIPAEVGPQNGINSPFSDPSFFLALLAEIRRRAVQGHLALKETVPP